MTPIATTEDLV